MLFLSQDPHNSRTEQVVGAQNLEVYRVVPHDADGRKLAQHLLRYDHMA